MAVAALAGCEPWPEPTAVTSTEPPGSAYVKACTIAAGLPCYLPGLGTLYVQPPSLPAGPFEAYDRNGDLVSTIYMVPIADFEAHEKLGGLASSPLPVTFVDIYYNAGHPGVPEPHYHIVLWHISRERAAGLE
jgi:hypothetical protein